MRRPKGFTLIELLVVISIIGLLMSILLPALGRMRKTAKQLQGTTQVRGIQQGMVLFAQSNQGFYPGMNSSGGEATEAADANQTIPYINGVNNGHNVEVRFAIMLGDELFPAKYLISPAESAAKTIFDASQAKTVTTFATTNYSFSLLRIDQPGQRANEWKDTTNAEAVVISDRLLNGALPNTAGNPTTYDSIHAENGWKGSIGFNDNHVEFVTNPEMSLKYGSNTLQNTDDIFEAAGVDDALIVGASFNLIPN